MPQNFEYSYAKYIGKHFIATEGGKPFYSYIFDDTFRMIIKNSIPGRAFKTARACKVLRFQRNFASWTWFQDRIAFALKNGVPSEYLADDPHEFDDIDNYIEWELDCSTCEGMKHL